ncbi:early light-induced protein 2, chloroplastic [Quercus suber]
MAVSSAMQSILARPPLNLVVSNRSTNRVNQFLIPTSYVPHLPRYASSMQVRCMAEEDQQEQPKPVTTSPSPPQPQQTPRPAPKVNTKFSNLLAFSGPALERINGKLAMIGFVSVMAMELSNGQDVFAHISNGGIPWFLGISIVLTLASLIPLFKGISVESKSDGFMTSYAEMWNGRFAMLGLVALAFTEYVEGGTLI